MIAEIRVAGPLGLLLQLDSLDDVLAVHQHLAENPLPGQVDAVAAASTVMLSFASRAGVRAARKELTTLKDLTFEAGTSRDVNIEVVYDGEDVDELASALDMSRDALIDWHSGQRWVGAFGGFAPGFTYCTALGEEKSVPRRPSPRTAVPERSVAVAGGFSSVYPRLSPGGWQLLGRTPSRMWDLDRESPAFVSPGDTVQYVPVPPESITITSDGDQKPAGDSPDAPGTAALTVVKPGMQLLIQDPGRAGHSDLGVSRAGVADEAAARQANRLVGNPESAAVLEILNGGTELRAERTSILAVTGAELSLTITSTDGATRTPAQCAPFALIEGERLALGMATVGMRAVLAIRGGVTGREELGSLSSDTMSGLGPAPLEAGGTIAVGGLPTRAVGEREPSTLPTRDADGAITVRFTYGPRDDWFDGDEKIRLNTQTWRVTAQANRVGVRLEPDPSDPENRPLARARTDELASEGVPRGSLQMPPEGNPVLFLNDHPVTGGYPVIGVVIPPDLSAAAQLRPGDTLRFMPVDPQSLTPTQLAASASS